MDYSNFKPGDVIRKTSGEAFYISGFPLQATIDRISEDGRTLWIKETGTRYRTTTFELVPPAKTRAQASRNYVVMDTHGNDAWSFHSDRMTLEGAREYIRKQIDGGAKNRFAIAQIVETVSVEPVFKSVAE